MSMIFLQNIYPLVATAVTGGRYSETSSKWAHDNQRTADHCRWFPYVALPRFQ